jgi:hypothetical protein
MVTPVIALKTPLYLSIVALFSLVTIDASLLAKFRAQRQVSALTLPWLQSYVGRNFLVLSMKCGRNVMPLMKYRELNKKLM